MNWFETLVIVMGTPTASALAVFFTQERLKAALLVSAQRQINEHKQVLDTYTESMKHSLQREMAKVEHTTRSKFAVYPKLYSKFVKASGAIGGLLGAKYATDHANITEEDIRSTLTSLNVMVGEQEKIIKTFQADRSSGIKAYERMLSELEVQSARKTFSKAKNYWLLNELFISDSTNKKIDDIVKELAQAYASASTVRAGHSYAGDKSFEKHRTSMEKANQAIRVLKEAMNKELEPSSEKNERLTTS